MWTLRNNLIKLNDLELFSVDAKDWNEKIKSRRIYILLTITIKLVFSLTNIPRNLQNKYNLKRKLEMLPGVYFYYLQNGERYIQHEHPNSLSEAVYERSILVRRIVGPLLLVRQREEFLQEGVHAYLQANRIISARTLSFLFFLNWRKMN